MNYECTVENFDRQPAVTIRYRVSISELSSLYGKTYQALYQYLGKNNTEPAGPPFTAYHNMDMQNLDVEIGLPVSRELPGQGDIKASSTPSGKAVTTMHVGAYDQIKAAYQAAMQYLYQNGFTPTGASYEMYLNDPSQTPTAQLRTLLVLPVK